MKLLTIGLCHMDRMNCDITTTRIDVLVSTGASKSIGDITVSRDISSVFDVGDNIAMFYIKVKILVIVPPTNTILH